MSSSLQITKKLLCVLLVAFSLVALAVADEVKETISLQDVLEAKRQSYQFAESTQAERSLEKTKASLYPNLSGSSRVTKAMGRDFQLSSSYTLSWNTPIGVNMQLKFVPRPGAQDSAVSFSVSASVWPLMTNSNGLVKLESGKKTLDRAERSDAQKLFNEELSLYQNYVKNQIQYEKLLMQEIDLKRRSDEYAAAEIEFQLGNITRSELEDKEIAYRSAFYQYKSAQLNFERSWTEFCQSLGLSTDSVPERVVYDRIVYPDLVWDLERDIARAKEISLDVLKAKDALDEAKKAVEDSRYSFIDSSLGFSVNVKELRGNSTPSWSVNLSMGFNTNDIFFNFTYKENQERYQSAEENYLAALKQVETDITRMQEDWELMVYQTKTREMNFIKAKRDLQAKKLQLEAGVIKESDYLDAERAAFERYLELLDQLVSLHVAANKAMFATGRTDRVVIYQ